MSVSTIFTISLYIANMIFAAAIIFVSRKKPSAVWAWLFVLFFLPIVGFIIYILLGRNLRKKNFVRWQAVHQKNYDEKFGEQQEAILNKTFRYPNKQSQKHEQLIHMNVVTNHAYYGEKNEIVLLDTGNAKFDTLVEDILQAKKYVHIQYYIYKMDDLGQRIYHALVEKAKEGLEVKLIYDDLGSRKLKKKHFKELTDHGGQVQAYFPSLFKLLNPRVNYRNHRKLAIIDGSTGYIGGFNVGNEYLGLDKKFNYWRDTHLKVVGTAVHSMQAHFLFDWEQAAGEPPRRQIEHYYPAIETTGTTPIQVVSSGPDTDHESIKKSYLRMIMSAKKYVYIQSPYFIPDEPFLEAVEIAAASGVDVRVMTPAKPDHMFVYGGNSAYGGDVLEAGGRVFRYSKGFIHAKMLLIDDEIVSIGTANIDVRSFSLNFEITALIFEEEFTKKCRALFEHDQEDSFEITEEIYENRPIWTKIREAFSRLISPIL